MRLTPFFVSSALFALAGCSVSVGAPVPQPSPEPACGGFRVKELQLYPPLATPGDRNRLQFSYQSSLCAAGCPLSLPVLEKSLVSIQVTGDTTGGYTMDLQPASAGTVAANETCVCTDATFSTGTVPKSPADPCPSGLHKFCWFGADIQTEAVGPVQLRVLDGGLNVVDTVSFSVEQAHEIKTIVAVNGQQTLPGADGAYPVHVGDGIEIQSLVTSAGGEAMVYTEHGLIPSYSDSSVVASNPCADGTDIEDSVARGPGTASVTMTGAGAGISMAFDVTPQVY
jgi:hypothetical protein